MHSDYFRSWYYESLARRSLRVVTGPTGEQITLQRAQQHLRLDLYGSPLGHPDDDLIQYVYIPMAREFCEVETARAMVPQEYELGIGSFSSYTYAGAPIKLPVGPIVSITSIEYTDAAGAIVALVPADWILDAYADRGYIYPAIGIPWPTTYGMANAVRIRFMAGYDLPASSPQTSPLPARYMGAMLLMLAHYYENRSATELSNSMPKELDLGVKALLQPDSLRSGFA